MENIMPRTKDYKKIAEKLEKEVAQLKIKINESYEKGFEVAYTEMEKNEALYEKHMVKAETEFYKKMSKKPVKKKKSSKKTASQKPKTKKPAPKSKKK